MIVVSDASPLIALAAIGRLDLLRALYSSVLVPEAVYREATRQRPTAPGAAAIRDADWIRSAIVADRALVHALSLELDPGESEAISLAVERHADLLLVDERRARRAASRLGQRVLGVLGVLVHAKHRGIVAEVRPLLQELIDDAGFRVAPDLAARVLDAVGE